MSYVLPINLRQLKRQAKILYADLQQLAREARPPQLADAQQMVAHLWRHANWHDAERAVSPAPQGCPSNDAGQNNAGLNNAASLIPKEQLARLTTFAISQRAERIHVDGRASSTRVFLRVDGELRPVPAMFGGDVVLRGAPPQTVACWIEQAATELGVCALDCVLIPIVGGWSLVMRLNYPNADIPLDRLGMSTTQLQAVYQALERRSGLITIAGVTGAGKSTTANAIAQEAKRRGIAQILVDEIRDGATLASTLAHVRGGGLAIATVHASSALWTLGRLASPAIGMARDVDPALFSLLVYQDLSVRPCPLCSQGVSHLGEEERGAYEWLATRHRLDLARVQVRGGGCARCVDGHAGRTGVFEVVTPTAAMIREALHGNWSETFAPWLRQSDGKIDSADMRGKRLKDHLLFRALQGEIDGGDQRLTGDLIRRRADAQGHG